MMVNEADGERRRFAGRYDREPPIPREISTMGRRNRLLDDSTRVNGPPVAKPRFDN
jgi:hypothetical protein